ncbi:hypothetical protein HY439_02050 [Candidatus Microgenomates bacterium]|nr:hypothetical protein [Candidatus Microgenomates bacterium]
MADIQTIARLFGSQSRVALLKLLLDNEDNKFRVNEIARKTNTNKRLVSTEVKKMAEIGLIAVEKVGNITFYKLNISSLLTKPLKEIFTEHDWYEWERPSRIHHLVLTLEAGLAPMKQYYGYSFPAAHLVFDYDNVAWFFRMSDFRKLGEKLIPIYLAKKKQVWKDFHGSASTLWDHKNYRSFYENYINFWKVAYIPEFISFNIDSLLKPGERIVIQEKSFTEEYEDLLWKMAKSAEQKGIENIDISPILKNYFWIRNSYYGIHRLTEEEIKTEVRKKIGKVKQKPTRMKDPTSLSKELIQVGKDMVLMQDIRKKYMMKAAYFLHEHLKVIGERLGLSMMQMEQTVPQEVLHIDKLMPELGEQLKIRQRSCTIAYDPKVGIKVFSGQIFFPKGVQRKAKFEVRGMVACGGKSVGRAKIVKNVDQIYKVNHGDIIVSPMTSPDLMPAIRRCVAIVTDFGGITCHAAIVAREFNVPCIVGTHDATEKIHDDDLVEVDANSGIVRVLERR